METDDLLFYFIIESGFFYDLACVAGGIRGHVRTGRLNSRAREYRLLCRLLMTGDCVHSFLNEKISCGILSPK